MALERQLGYKYTKSSLTVKYGFDVAVRICYNIFMKCFKCKKQKSKKQFDKDRTKLRGYHSYCKKCRYKLYKGRNTKEQSKKWRLENKKWIQEYDRKRNLKRRKQLLVNYTKWRKKNPALHNLKCVRRIHRLRANGGDFTRQEWEELKRKFKFRCAHCNKRKKLTIDHIKPASKKGRNDIKNIQPLCRPCNSRKKDHI